MNIRRASYQSKTQSASESLRIHDSILVNGDLTGFPSARIIKECAKNERGNILFLILLAVVLFAALSYAVTQSMRGGGKDASAETMKLEISTIQNAGIQFRTALDRMFLVGGLQEWQIEFADVRFTPYTANTSCTSDTCRLHQPSGGGVSGHLLPAQFRASSTDCAWATTPFDSGKYRFINVSIKGIGGDNIPDIVLNYPCVTTDLCMAANDASGVANPGGAPPVDLYSDDSCGLIAYNKALTSSTFPTTRCPELGVTAPGLAGKQMFCAYNDTTSGNNIYYVVKER